MLSLTVLLGIKIAVFLYICASPFLPVYDFMNSVIFKVLILILIVGCSFVDIQLSILLTIAFLIIMINIFRNKKEIYKKQNESFSTPEVIYNNPEMSTVATPPFFETIVKLPGAQCNDMRQFSEQINNDLFDIYIDEKVKPYESTIKKMTSPTHLDIAQNNELF